MTGRSAIITILLLAFAVALCHGQESEPIDFEKALQLRRRAAQGEKLSEEEQAYLQRAIAARRAAPGRQPAGRPGGARVEPKASTGLKPLVDMSADDRYGDVEDGGLYGGGKNVPPEKHLAAALAAARQIEPLDAEGKPAAQGRIVLASVGMSNTTQEFSRFVRLAGEARDLHPRLSIVDGAQGGMDSRAWARPESLPAQRPDPWKILASRLDASGASPRQVQVVWVKQARIAPGSIGEFPKHVDALRDDLRTIVVRLKQEFPNLRLVYLSSRIYGGYAASPLNPEPYAYESAFAVRRLIAEQIAGEGKLAIGTVDRPQMPVLLWGPYLWADGESGRKIDELVYRRDDLTADGTHPSDSGRLKVAEQLLRFFREDATAKGWFLRPE